MSIANNPKLLCEIVCAKEDCGVVAQTKCEVVEYCKENEAIEIVPELPEHWNYDFREVNMFCPKHDKKERWL